MRKWCFILLLPIMVFFGFLPASEAAPKTTTVALILLGSIEFQRVDYYPSVTESWKKRFPESTHTLFVGNGPQKLFESFSDQMGLLPGEIPSDENLKQFSRSQPFDEVVFIILSPPSIKSSDITIQREYAQVTLAARAVLLSSQDRTKLLEAQTQQIISAIGRNNAKRAAFIKCMNVLQEKL